MGKGRDILEDVRREGDRDGVKELPNLLLRDPAVEALLQLRSTVALDFEGIKSSATILTTERVVGKELTPRTIMPTLATNMPRSMISIRRPARLTWTLAFQAHTAM